MAERMEEGTSLLLRANSASLKGDAERTTQAEKLPEKETLSGKKTEEIGSLVLPNFLATTNPDSGAILEQLARSESTVKSSITSIPAERPTYQDKERLKNHLAEQVAAQAQVTSDLQIATSGKALANTEDSVNEEHPLSQHLGQQLNASPTIANLENVAQPDHGNTAASSSSNFTPSSSSSSMFGLPMTENNYSNNSTSSAFSSTDSAYLPASSLPSTDMTNVSFSTSSSMNPTFASHQFYDPGYYSQSFEPPEYSVETLFTKETPSTLGGSPTRP